MASVDGIIAKLRNAIETNNLGQLLSCLSSAANLSADSGMNADPRLQELSSLIMQAQGMVLDTSSGSAKADSVVPDVVGTAEEVVYKHFSAKEKAYYDSFKSDGKYKIQDRDEHGNLKYDAEGKPVTKEVSGEEIKHSFREAKYYSLPKEERDKADAANPEVKHDFSEAAKEDLKKSVRTLQSDKALKLHEAGRDDEVKANEAKLTKTLDQIDVTWAAAKAVSSPVVEDKGEAPNDPMAHAKKAAAGIKQQNDARTEQEKLTHMMAEIVGNVSTPTDDKAKEKPQEQRFQSDSVTSANPTYVPAKLVADSAARGSSALVQ